MWFAEIPSALTHDKYCTVCRTPKSMIEISVQIRALTALLADTFFRATILAPHAVLQKRNTVPSFQIQFRSSTATDALTFSKA